MRGELPPEPGADPAPEPDRRRRRSRSPRPRASGPPFRHLALLIQIPGVDIDARMAAEKGAPLGRGGAAHPRPSASAWPGSGWTTFAPDRYRVEVQDQLPAEAVAGLSEAQRVFLRVARRPRTRPSAGHRRRVAGPDLHARPRCRGVSSGDAFGAVCGVPRSDQRPARRLAAGQPRAPEFVVVRLREAAAPRRDGAPHVREGASHERRVAAPARGRRDASGRARSPRARIPALVDGRSRVDRAPARGTRGGGRRSARERNTVSGADRRGRQGRRATPRGEEVAGAARPSTQIGRQLEDARRIVAELDGSSTTRCCASRTRRIRTSRSAARRPASSSRTWGEPAPHAEPSGAGGRRRGRRGDASAAGSSGRTGRSPTRSACSTSRPAPRSPAPASPSTGAPARRCSAR